MRSHAGFAVCGGDVCDRTPGPHSRGRGHPPHPRETLSCFHQSLFIFFSELCALPSWLTRLEPAKDDAGTKDRRNDGCFGAGHSCERRARRARHMELARHSSLHAVPREQAGMGRFEKFRELMSCIDFRTTVALPHVLVARSCFLATPKDEETGVCAGDGHARNRAAGLQVLCVQDGLEGEWSTPTLSASERDHQRSRHAMLSLLLQKKINQYAIM
jgi:hypothetical protein